MDLPPFPDAGEPCVNENPLVLVAVCSGGTRTLAWAFASEIINTTIPDVSSALKQGGTPATEPVKDKTKKK